MALLVGITRQIPSLPCLCKHTRRRLPHCFPNKLVFRTGLHFRRIGYPECAVPNNLPTHIGLYEMEVWVGVGSRLKNGSRDEPSPFVRWCLFVSDVILAPPYPGSPKGSFHCHAMRNRHTNNQHHGLEMISRSTEHSSLALPVSNRTHRHHRPKIVCFTNALALSHSGNS